MLTSVLATCHNASPLPCAFNWFSESCGVSIFFGSERTSQAVHLLGMVSLYLDPSSQLMAQRNKDIQDLVTESLELIFRVDVGQMGNTFKVCAVTARRAVD